MANPLYGYNGTGYGTSSATLSGAYSSRSVSEQYLPDSSLRYLSSDPLSASNRSSMYYPSASASAAARISSTPAHLTSQTSWSSLDSSLDPVSGLKRSSEAFYHPTGLGAHNAIGQSEAWLSADYLAKRPRLESASNLPIYPQRPGEKDCVHYMQTRTCKFGDGCKFDHPIWVPEGGIPDWKEVPFVPIEALPERPGEADCPYFMKTQKCKFGLNCKFNHPKDYVTPLAAPEKIDASTLPERPTEPSCSFYMKTGTCKFGTTCIFHHPRDIQIPSVGQENGTGVPAASASNGVGTYDGKPANSIFPAIAFNSKGLPIRLGEVDCPFYLKTGSCKYGAACRYSHPDRNAINPPAAAMGNPFGVSPAATLNVGVVNPAASVLSAVDPRLASTVLGLGAAIYPQRPGQTECDYYMKTGVCKYVERCKFHHPIDRSAPLPKVQENVKLTPAGFPRREGAIHCPYYMKTGICKYAAACKFDHPPPGEVMAMATLPTSVEGEGKEDGEEDGAGVAQIQ